MWWLKIFNILIVKLKIDAKIASKHFHIYQIFYNEMCLSIRYNFPIQKGGGKYGII
nr:MAG TPA: hypothetical protein [Caudoviricetes sp.]